MAGHSQAPKETAIRRAIAVAIALVAAIAVTVPALGASDTVNVPGKLKKVIPTVKRKTGLPVLLPSRLNAGVTATRVIGTGSTTSRPRGYDLELGVGRRCGGANACFVAAFFGRRGARPDLRKKAKLARGITGFWKGLSCGASCAPGEIQWVQSGVLYDIQFKNLDQGSEKSTLVGLANQAIKAGPR